MPEFTGAGLVLGGDGQATCIVRGQKNMLDKTCGEESCAVVNGTTAKDTADEEEGDSTADEEETPTFVLREHTKMLNFDSSRDGPMRFKVSMMATNGSLSYMVFPEPGGEVPPPTAAIHSAHEKAVEKEKEAFKKRNAGDAGAEYVPSTADDSADEIKEDDDGEPEEEKPAWTHVSDHVEPVFRCTLPWPFTETDSMFQFGITSSTGPSADGVSTDEDGDNAKMRGATVKIYKLAAML